MRPWEQDRKAGGLRPPQRMRELMTSCGLVRALVGTSPSPWETAPKVLTWSPWEALAVLSLARTLGVGLEIQVEVG